MAMRRNTTALYLQMRKMTKNTQHRHVTIYLEEDLYDKIQKDCNELSIKTGFVVTTGKLIKSVLRKRYYN